jgi:hypothetical protein
MSDSLIPVLFGITLVAFIVYGLMQWRSAKKAQQTHEKSAMPEPDTLVAQQRVNPSMEADAPAVDSTQQTSRARSAAGR